MHLYETIMDTSNRWQYEKNRYDEYIPSARISNEILMNEPLNVNSKSIDTPMDVR